MKDGHVLVKVNEDRYVVPEAVALEITILRRRLQQAYADLKAGRVAISTPSVENVSQVDLGEGEG